MLVGQKRLVSDTEKELSLVADSSRSWTDDHVVERRLELEKKASLVDPQYGVVLDEEGQKFMELQALRDRLEELHTAEQRVLAAL
jgi:hypothetical protein